MGNMKAPLRLVQLGQQPAIGTEAAATWQADFPMEFSDAATVDRPQAMHGYMVASPAAEHIVEQAVSFSIPAFPMSYEHLVPLLLMGVDMGITSSVVEAATVWSWTHARPKASLPTSLVKPMTIEAHSSDGTTDVDDKYLDAFLTSFQISIAQGQSATFSGSGIANRRQDEGSFTDLSASFPLSSVTRMPAQTWTLYLEDDISSLPGAGHGAEVLSATINVETGLQATRTLSGDTNLGYSQIDLDGFASRCTIEATCIARPGASDLLKQERGKAESAALRAVRLSSQGPTLGGSSKLFYLQMAAKHTPGGYNVLGSENGNEVFTMQLESSVDPGATNWMAAFLRNGIEDLTP